MSDNKIMVIGVKETFLIRVLIKKLNDAGFNAEFVPENVSAINAKWSEATLITYYNDALGGFRDDVVRFLSDKMMDDEKQLIAIGEDEYLPKIIDNIPSNNIYKTFTRPLDNEAYMKTVEDLFYRISSGEFDKKTILIVDDDPTYLGLVRDWLKIKYKIAMATSGLQAIKWLGKNKSDLILLDYEMPVTTGPQVLEMLRSDDETKNIPVIFLTGKGDKQSVMSVVGLKPEGYFLKNIGRQELLINLEKFFMGRK